MHNRSAIIDTFLAHNGWQGAKRAPLAGDASFRRYERIHLNDKHAVLMDAPPEKEDIRPFIHVAELLAKHQLSAPALLASDTAQGLLLLEDLGDDLFARVLHKTPEEEENIYLVAAEVLAELYKAAPRTDYAGIPAYDNERLTREYMLLAEWFLPMVQDDVVSKKAAQEYHALWQETLAHLPALQPVLVLRDYHAENLLWLPQRDGVKRIGLLDFQDAVIGSPAYDMVSLLEDARRDVQPSTVEHVSNTYCNITGIDKEAFATSYALLGAQRNCKIIGIFCRLAVRDNKQNYLSLLPRVWKHLEHDMQHPALAKLRQWCDSYVPKEMRSVLHIKKRA